MDKQRQELENSLREVKNVEQWNNVRDRLKRVASIEVIISIDTSGLITQVLGKDSPKIYHTPAPLLMDETDY